MITDHRPALKTLNMPARKTLQKKGTIAVAVVEATPVVWKGELLRFEWLRNNEWDTAKINVRDVGRYHFVNMETNEPTPNLHFTMLSAAAMRKMTLCTLTASVVPAAEMYWMFSGLPTWKTGRRKKYCVFPKA